VPLIFWVISQGDSENQIDSNQSRDCLLVAELALRALFHGLCGCFAQDFHLS
jgi:hypothetical protein